MMICKPEYRVPSMAEIAALPPNGYSIVSTFSGCGGSCLGFKMAGFRVLWASEFIPAAQETYRANHAGTFLHEQDIRLVTPDEILDKIGREFGDVDVLEGSPPCASFSTAGKRSEGWQQVRSYSDAEQRVDDLFFEFARILEGVQPRIFVAENVSGLVKGTAKGYFFLILKRLKDAGYNVEARVLDAQWLGVPQARQRLVFIGTRADLPIRPQHPLPLPYRYTVRDAIPWLHEMTLVPHGPNSFEVPEHPMEMPAPAVLTSANGGSWYNHLVETESDISRYAIAAEWDKLAPGGQSDKYFQLIRQDPERPSGTITALGGSNGGVACVTHPYERRKFSILELKRICGFPDDFILTGTYAQQWERLGRAVPPVMMAAVATEVRALLDQLQPPEGRAT